MSGGRDPRQRKQIEPVSQTDPDQSPSVTVRLRTPKITVRLKHRRK